MTHYNLFRMAAEVMPELIMPSTPEQLEQFANIVAAPLEEEIKRLRFCIPEGDAAAAMEYLAHCVEKAVAAEREACAKLCEEKTTCQIQIPCPDGKPGCLVFHAVEAKREKTGSECAAAIRARGNT